MQAQGYGLEWGHITSFRGHPERAIRSVSPDHGDLALGMVPQAQGNRVGSLRPRTGTKVHIKRLYTDSRGKDSQVPGAIKKVLRHGGDLGVLRGWQVLQVLHRERLGQGSNIIPLAADFLRFPPFQKRLQALPASHPQLQRCGTQAYSMSAREGTGDLERAACLPGGWNVWHPTYRSGQHEGPILIPFQPFLF